MKFIVDKENKKITIERQFKAPLNKVWAAWTESHLLDKWWAPKPWKAETKSMDFKDGGFWLYAMVGPEGEKHWARADYTLIEILKGFSVLDAFCDEEGNINTDFPRSSWQNSFEELSGTTTVTCQISHSKLEDLEKYIAMGFKEGFTMALENLDQVLA